MDFLGPKVTTEFPWKRWGLDTRRKEERARAEPSTARPCNSHVFLRRFFSGLVAILEVKQKVLVRFLGSILVASTKFRNYVWPIHSSENETRPCEARVECNMFVDGKHLTCLLIVVEWEILT